MQRFSTEPLISTTVRSPHGAGYSVSVGSPQYGPRPPSTPPNPELNLNRLQHILSILEQICGSTSLLTLLSHNQMGQGTNLK